MKKFLFMATLLLSWLPFASIGAQNVAKVGTTEYATIEEAIEAWGPGKTLTLLANVQTTSTVVVEVNATKSTSNWTLDLGDYTWTASGCNAFQLYAAGGTVMNQNYGMKIYANQNGGITASGKYCIECKYDNSTAGYRPRLEIHGGTYNGSNIIYYASLTWNSNSVSNGPSTWFFKSNDGTEPIFNGNFALAKCPITINAGYFNGTSFNTYPVTSTANTNLYGGHFKSISAYPSNSNSKNNVYGNYKIFYKTDGSIDIVNGAPNTYEASTTSSSTVLGTAKATGYPGPLYFENANYAIQKYNIPITLNENVVATQDKTISSSATLTIDATAEGSSYTGNVILANNSAKLVMKFPEGGGHYGVSVNSGTLHVEETIADGIVTRTYSRIATISNPEAKVGSTSYSTVYDAFYAIDGTTDNKTIVLQKDVTNAGIITNGTATGGDGKTVATFDLNGHSIGIGSAAAGNNADYTLTIIDSSEGKTGTVTNSDASLLILALTGISDYSGSYTLKVQGGTWQFDPSAVSINGETHNLVDEGYVARNNGDGTWTVVETTRVAQIGTTKYSTLQAAVNAAQQIGGAVIINIINDISGETVTINEVANFQLTIDGQKDADSNYTVDATIVVDGLRGNGGSTTNGASVTLQNIAFVKTTATDGIQATHYPHHLTIQDCTYSGYDNDKWFLNASVDGPLYGVTVKNVTVENARLIYANLADDAVFQNITATNDIKVGFNVKTSGSALIENCQVTTGKYAFRDYSDGYEGSFTLKDNTFISTSEESDEGVIVNRGGSDGTAHIIVESGTYTGHIKVLNNKEGALAISGGYFSEEFPQEYIAADLEGKVCVPATDMEGFFTVGDPHYVAQIGETQYVSLQAALDAAHEMTDDVTIFLIDDITGYSIVHQKAGLNLTIDGADKTIVGQIVVDGNGRLNDSETLTIKNIKFVGNKNDFYTGTDAFISLPAKISALGIGNYNYAHNVTVSGCSFTSTSENNPEFDVVAFKPSSGKNFVINNVTGTNLHSIAQFTGTEKANITNCTATECESFVNVSGGKGEFTISGNTFTSAEGASGYGIRENGASSAVITLTDNTFNAANAVVLGKKVSATNGTINVVSGTYVGDIVKDIAATATGQIVISGGKFSAPLADAQYAEFIAEGLCGVNGLYPEEELAKNGIGTAVASVTNGETTLNYASLEAAFAAAADGSTVTLLADASGNGIKVPQGKFTTGLIVDFGSFTYTVDGETVGSTGTQTQAFQLLKDNKITFKNGTIYSEKAKMLVQNYSDLTLEGMTLTLNNESYTSAYTLSNNNGSVVIDGSTINVNPAGGFAFDVCRYASYPSVNVEVKGESVINGNIEISASGNDAKDGFGLKLTAGTFNGNIVLDASAEAVLNATPEKAVIKKSNSLTSVAAPADYKWVPAEEEGYSTLAPKVYLAQIGDVKYESLAEAVAAVPADGTETTITMIDNEMINVSGYAITIPATKNVVLDLNGYQVVGTVEQEGTSALIRNLGTLTIKDSSDTNADGTGTGKLMSGASPTWTWDGTDDYSGSYASNLIRNEKNLIVESGNLYNMSKGSAAYAIDNYSAGNVTINGGKVDAAKASAIRMFYVNGGSISVTGGVIGRYNSDDDCTYMGIQVMSGSNVNVTITGGTISGDYAFYANNTGGSIAISGGTLDGYVMFGSAGPNNISITGGAHYYVYAYGSQTKFITGGIYANPVNEAYCAEGYIPAANTDPETMEAYPYVVKAGQFVAQIGTTKYETLEAAFAAAEDGATITLLANCAGNGIQVPQGKYATGLTVDFGGFTYTMDGAMVGSTGTQTQAFQLLKDNKITFKNGTIYSEKALFLIQNYSDLTLEGMTLTLNNSNYTSAYTLSNNNGNVVIDGSTINANPAGGFAFDVCRYASYPSVNVEVKGESVINGNIEISASGNDAKDGFGLMLTAGTFNGNIVLDASAAAAMETTPEKVSITKADAVNVAAPEDYKWVATEVEGFSKLAPKVYVAQVEDGDKYESLAEAVETAEEGATITLLATTDEAVEVAKTLTIVKGEFTAANVTAADDFLKTETDEKITIAKFSDLDIVLVDGEPYTYTKTTAVKSVTYKRNIGSANTKYAWYVPFDYTITAEDAENFTFYRINMVANAPSTADEPQTKNIWVYLKTMNVGEKLTANRPYVFKSNSAIVGKEFKVEENAMIYAPNRESRLNCSTTFFIYDFYGTYETVNLTEGDKAYYMGGGQLHTVVGEGVKIPVGSYRWYIKTTQNGDGGDYAPIFVFTEDEDDATGISQKDNVVTEESYYNLNGMRINKPARGAYIIKYSDGSVKKVVVK